MSEKTRLRLLAIAIIAFALTACGGSSPVAGTPATQDQTAAALTPVSGEAEVIIQMQAFNPRFLTVRVGTTITWSNADIVAHSVHADSEAFRSELLANGQSFSFTFKNPGKYPYYCDPHGGPGGQGMSGVIEVVP